MKRIDPQSVPAICRELELTPIRHLYTRGGCQACLIGILASKATSFERAEAAPQNSVSLGKLAGFSEEYSEGLNDGWEQVGYHSFHSREYDEGYEDGQKAYQACLDAKLEFAKL